jgi:hypothetical protein
MPADIWSVGCIFCTISMNSEITFQCKLLQNSPRHIYGYYSSNLHGVNCS